MNFCKATLYDLPVLPYDTAWNIQRDLAEQVRSNSRANALLLLEHERVFTLGRTTRGEHYGHRIGLLEKHGIPVHAVRRGGSVTYHGPGQIIGYPILQLRKFCAGPKIYMHMLEEVIIRVLGEYGMEGRRLKPYPGVWMTDPTGSPGQPAKIASMGVRIERGITMHGFALNVTMDLTPFELIVPCGIQGCRVTSMREGLGENPDLQTIRNRLAHHFSAVFGLEWKGVYREPPVVEKSLPRSA